MSWKKDNGYVGSFASAQMLAVFQCMEPTDDYPPHYMDQPSVRSLDQKLFKDLTVKLFSFLCTISTNCATSHFLKHVKALC